MKHAYRSVCSLLAATFLAVCGASQGLAADGKPAPMAVDKNDPRSGALINAIAAKRKHATQMPLYKAGAQKTITNTPVNNPAADATAQDTQSETTIVDLGGGNLVAAYNDSGSFISGNHFTGYSFSSNNGKTWTDGGKLPDSTEGDAGDPVLAVNRTTGAVYMATLGFATFENLQVFKSVDSGHTWGAPVNGTPGYAGSGDFQDKSWLTIDNFAGSGNGNLYLCWTNFGANAEIRLTRSTDGGATFGPSLGTFIASDLGDNVQGCNVVVSPNHQVNVFYYRREGNGKLYVRRSTDRGVTFGAETLIANLNTTAINGNLNLNGGLRSNSFPQAAVNPKSARPYLYVVYNDDPSLADTTDNGAVYMVRSTDNGATWSAPVVVDNSARDQFFPAIGIPSAGERFMVSWYTRGQDLNNFMFHRQGVLGVLNGAGNPVFNPNSFQLGVNTPVVIGQDPVINTTYMGDYDSIAGGSGHLSAIWSDNRTGNAFHARQPDVFFAQILVPPSASDLSMLVTPTPPTINFGDTTSVALQVTATGGAARDVFLHMEQVVGLPIQSVSSPGGPCSLINGFLDCSLGAIRSGASKTVTVVLRGLATGTKTISARASTSSIDAATTNNIDSARIRVLTGTTVTRTFSTGDVAIALPDVATTDISLPVGVTGTAVNLIPSVRLNHTFDGDLSLFLIDPAGNSVELSSRNGGGGDNYGSGANSCSGSVLTAFDDTAATSITAGVAPFAGTFKPEAPLSGLAGSAVNGTWKLRVIDNAGGDFGTFFCFKLTITRIP